MIEFKADCGHTIRVEDQHAGKIVQCAYCGREVEAPQLQSGDTGILFSEVDLNELAKGEGHGAGRRPLLTIAGQQRGGTSPEAAQAEQVATQNKVIKIVLIFAYVTIGVVVLVFSVNAVLNIGEEGSQTAFRDGSGAENPMSLNKLPVASTPSRSGSQENSDTVQQPSTHPRGTDQPSIAQRGRINFSAPPGSSGVFVESFSDEARVYLRAQDSDNGTTLGADKSEYRGSGPTRLELPVGDYRLAVTMDLDASYLAELPGFEDVRDALAFGAGAEAVQSFLARDASVAADFIDQRKVPQRLVRYYDVTVAAGSWSAVTALFVSGDTPQRVLGRLPDETLYGFDHENARRELSAAGFSTRELSTLVNFLSQAGQVVHTTGRDVSMIIAVDPARAYIHSLIRS